MPSPGNAQKPQIWPLSLSQNRAKFRKINKPWPRTNQFWRWSRYIGVQNFRPFPTWVLQVKRSQLVGWTNGPMYRSKEGISGFGRTDGWTTQKHNASKGGGITNHNQHAFNIKYLANLIKKYWTCFRYQKLADFLLCFPPSVRVQVQWPPSGKIGLRIQFSFGFWGCAVKVFDNFSRKLAWLLKTKF